MPGDIVKTFKIPLDESDVAYFRARFREAKRDAAGADPKQILESVREMIARVRSQKKIPSYLQEAVETLESLGRMVEDEKWALPKSEAAQILGGLAYFMNPADLIPDEIPAMGFLDDAIFIWLLGEEFQHDIWGYRKFRKLLTGSEQRPWTEIARARAAARVSEFREEVRGEIQKRKLKRRFSIW